jgi:hypothetical protein
MTDDAFHPIDHAAFRRRWRPGRWLSIVKGIWIDPLWYWSNIRPELDKRWWIISLQGILGGGLTALGLASAFGILLAAAGRSVDWADLVRETLWIAVSLVPVGAFLGITSAYSGRGGNFKGYTAGRWAAHAIPLAVALEVVGGVYPLARNFSGLEGWNTPWEAAAFVAVIVLAFGVAFGIGFAVANGAVPKIIYLAVVLTALIVGIVMAGGSDQPLLMAAEGAGICAILALSVFLTERWAIRQVPDAAERKRLADP